MTDITIIKNLSGIEIQSIALIYPYISKCIDPVVTSVGIGTIGPHQHIFVADTHIPDETLGIGCYAFIGFPIISLLNIDAFFLLRITV